MKKMTLFLFLLFTFNSLTFAADAKLIDKQIKEADVDRQYFDSYVKRSNYLEGKTTHTARIEGVAVFKRERSNSAFSSMTGLNKGACSSSDDGVGMMGETADYCQCPPNNLDVKCIKSFLAQVHVDPDDIGGNSYFVLYAEKGDDVLVLLKDYRWHPLEDVDQGAYTFNRPITKSIENFVIPGPFKSVCAGLGNGPISFYLGYGTADRVEMDYLRKLNRLDRSLDVSEQAWEQAKLTAFNQNKTKMIAKAQCSFRR